MIKGTNEDYWAAVRAMRLGVADLLDDLSPQEWEHGSLCSQWRVRDVAGHLSLVPTVGSLALLAAAPLEGFNLHRVNTRFARRYARPEPSEIVARIREHAGTFRTARLLSDDDSLFDVMVHSQDIARPLGRVHGVPLEYLPPALDRVWSMGWPFRARRRLAGRRLRARDVDWTAGEGPLVEGNGLDLLLLLTGRTETVRGALDGDGLDGL